MTDADITLAETPPTAGQLLATERERQGLSIADTAQNLKLGIKQVEALEADDYAKLPGRTFVRGFVRNYARLLQIDVVPLLAMIENVEAPTPLYAARPAGKPFLSGNRKKHPGRFILWILLLVALTAAGFYGWRYYDAHFTASPGNAPVAALPTPEAAPAANAPAPAIAPVAPVATNDAGNQSSNEKTIAAPNPPIAAPAPGVTAAPSPLTAEVKTPLASAPAGEQLRFRFTRDSWVEIRNKQGAIVFSQLNPAGSEQLVTAKTPLSLVIGNAAYVTLSLNDKPIDLKPYIKIEVARLTLE